MHHRAEPNSKRGGYNEHAGAFGHVAAPSKRNGDISMANIPSQVTCKALERVRCIFEINLEARISASKNARQESPGFQRLVGNIQLTVETQCVHRRLKGVAA